LEKSAFHILQTKSYRAFIMARLFLVLGISIQAVVVGWQVYDITKSEFALGLVGLAEAIPFIITSLFGGHLADIYNRKKIVSASNMLYLFCAVLLAIVSYYGAFIFQVYGVWPIYLILFIAGISRGFLAPAQGALIPQIVKKEQLVDAGTVGSMTFYTASIAGGAFGGLLCAAIGPMFSYWIVVGLSLIGLAKILQIGKIENPPPQIAQEKIFTKLFAGINFVFKNEILLAALALDMFAVLFGGAVAILPAFADKILHVGAFQYGLLRTAPSLGIVIVTLYLAYHPPRLKAGKILMYCVAGFGVATILFSLSKNIYLCFFFLMLSGVFDGVSVVIRSTIVPLFSPDYMRGRIEAVNKIFIGSSNEIGMMESGAAARWMGLVPSILFGGCMTLAVVSVTWWKAKKLRTLDL